MNDIASRPPAETPAHRAAALAARIDAILAGLLLVIGAHQHLLGRFALPVWTRISRMRRRFARLLARPLLARPLGEARPDPVRDPGATRRHGVPAPYIPRRHAWLVHIIGYRAAAYMSHLEHLFRDPETQAILAAASQNWTRAVGRPLRPLCRLLGVTPPPVFQSPNAPAPRPPRAAKAPPPPLATRPPRPRQPAMDGVHLPTGLNFIFRTI